MDLAQNPFFILGATPKDGRHRLLELAEEKSLSADGQEARDAAACLTNPRKRLVAEMAWLPGAPGGKAVDILSRLDVEPAAVRKVSDVFPLARCNVLASGLKRAIRDLGIDEIVDWVLVLSETYDGISATEVSTVLNADRRDAGLPEVSDIRHVESEIVNRREEYRVALREALDELQTETLVEAVTLIADRATKRGAVHPPTLVCDVVDAFEVEAQAFFDKETENISSLIRRLDNVETLDESDEGIRKLVNGLDGVVRNWDRVAQPIQLIARSRGLTHGLSQEVASEIRSAAVTLVRNHGFFRTAKELIALKKDVFAEIDNIIEQADEDDAALRELEKGGGLCVDDIAYQVDLGWIFERKLRISPEGIEWQGARMSLGDIKKMRWGLCPQSRKYEVFVGNDEQLMHIDMRSREVFTEFVQKLWRAVGLRLLEDLLKGLRDGKRYRFGRLTVDDYGVVFMRERWFADNERVKCTWDEVVVRRQDGMLCLDRYGDKRFYAELPYRDIHNVYLLDVALDALKKCGHSKLSELLG